MPPSKARTAPRRSALGLCRLATQEAQTIAMAAVNGHPLALAELIAASIKAKAPAEPLAGILPDAMKNKTTP
ncbi:MAG: hypothetical protein WA086_11775 [Ideonella sp.]